MPQRKVSESSSTLNPMISSVASEKDSARNKREAVGSVQCLIDTSTNSVVGQERSSHMSASCETREMCVSGRGVLEPLNPMVPASVSGRVM